MTYYVTFKIDGRYTVQLDAESQQDAEEIATAIFEAANLNEMDIIDSKLIITEDEHGNFLREE